MHKHIPSPDVYCDQANGEFRLLLPAELAYLYSEIKNAFLQSQAILDGGAYTLSKRCTLVSWAMDYINFVDDVEGEFIPVRHWVTMHSLHQRDEYLEEMTTIVISEQADIAHTLLHHDYHELHTLTEEYVTQPCSERYVFSVYADGSYDGQVEQYDLTSKKGEVVRRPMTIYDAECVLRQVETAVERTAARMV